ncbi:MULTISPECIES: hypothetical protein [Mycobacterium]|uniref:hypothetical protein n=1 Tax=Mycobacterium TaxID=1763 RepID=UPI0010420FDA|nr:MULTISPECIES: hypothetical protein [Mycobacterium]MCG7609755.1 hypothetical protein [Mycobacterium sp. CnD-18-1]
MGAGSWPAHIPVATVGRSVTAPAGVPRLGITRVLQDRSGLVVVAAPAGYASIRGLTWLVGLGVVPVGWSWCEQQVLAGLPSFSCVFRLGLSAGGQTVVAAGGGL